MELASIHQRSAADLSVAASPAPTLGTAATAAATAATAAEEIGVLAGRRHLLFTGPRNGCRQTAVKSAAATAAAAVGLDESQPVVGLGLLRRSSMQHHQRTASLDLRRAAFPGAPGRPMRPNAACATSDTVLRGPSDGGPVTSLFDQLTSDELTTTAGRKAVEIASSASLTSVSARSPFEELGAADTPAAAPTHHVPELPASRALHASPALPGFALLVSGPGGKQAATAPGVTDASAAAAAPKVAAVGCGGDSRPASSSQHVRNLSLDSALQLRGCGLVQPEGGATRLVGPSVMGGSRRLPVQEPDGSSLASDDSGICGSAELTFDAAAVAAVSADLLAGSLQQGCRPPAHLLLTQQQQQQLEQLLVQHQQQQQQLQSLQQHQQLQRLQEEQQHQQKLHFQSETHHKQSLAGCRDPVVLNETRVDVPSVANAAAPATSSLSAFASDCTPTSFVSAVCTDRDATGCALGERMVVPTTAGAAGLQSTPTKAVAAILGRKAAPSVEAGTVSSADFVDTAAGGATAAGVAAVGEPGVQAKSTPVSSSAHCVEDCAHRSQQSESLRFSGRSLLPGFDSRAGGVEPDAASSTHTDRASATYTYPDDAAQSTAHAVTTTDSCRVFGIAISEAEQDDHGESSAFCLVGSSTSSAAAGKGETGSAEPRPPYSVGLADNDDKGGGGDGWPSPPSACRVQSGLLRLFESRLFTMRYAVQYLSQSREAGVLAYIGNRMFAFDDNDVSFYLPQLVCLYVHHAEVAEAIKPYLVVRCRRDADFSLQLSWLLSAFCADCNAPSRKMSQGLRLRNVILSEELGLGPVCLPVAPNHLDQASAGDVSSLLTAVTVAERARHPRRVGGGGGSGCGHHRSRSDASGVQQPKIVGSVGLLRRLGDLASGHAFDSGCRCSATCACGAPRLAAQNEFVKALIALGRKLTSIPTKDMKTQRLQAELTLLNMNLPARVWLPVHNQPHFVVRIPPQAAAVLNSKDRAPYLIYVEVVAVDDITTSPVPVKFTHSSIRVSKSEENLERDSENAGSNGSSSNPPSGSLSSSSSCQHLSVQTGAPAANGTNAPATGHLSDTTGNGGVCFSFGDEWSADDDEITAQLAATVAAFAKTRDRDTLSIDSGVGLMTVGAGDIRRRLTEQHDGPSGSKGCLVVGRRQTLQRDPEDPSAAALKEPLDFKIQRIRDASPYGGLSSWKLISAIVKCGDDLRQELMASQLLSLLQIIWAEEKIPLWIRPYQILVTGHDSGMIEPILDTMSLHQLKKLHGNCSLLAFFEREFGQPTSEPFLEAQKNFVQSCAAYSILSYLIQIKDRHNGNILLDGEGHVIHIDFGFILSSSPKNLGFESSPFKLTQEFVQVMGGTSSDMFEYFKVLMLKGLLAAKKHQERLISVVETLQADAQLPCFLGGKGASALRALKDRFLIYMTEEEMAAKVDAMVESSLHSITTRLYDGFQYFTNGIH